VMARMAPLSPGASPPPVLTRRRIAYDSIARTVPVPGGPWSAQARRLFGGPRGSRKACALEKWHGVELHGSPQLGWPKPC
jgi:hypothetical protein